MSGFPYYYRANDAFRNLIFTEQVPLKSAHDYLRTVTFRVCDGTSTEETRRSQLGSAFLFSDRFQWLTCAHVVKRDGQIVKNLVVFMDNHPQRYPVQVVAIDDRVDLALLSMPTAPTETHKNDFLEMPASAETNQLVFCAGFPSDTCGLIQVTKGALTASPDAHCLIANCAVDPQCAGGPCVGGQLKCLIGVIRGDLYCYGPGHQQRTAVIPFHDVDDFLQRHGYALKQYNSAKQYMSF